MVDEQKEKTSALLVYVPPKLKAAIKHKAIDLGITLQKYVVKILEDGLK